MKRLTWIVTGICLATALGAGLWFLQRETMPEEETTSSIPGLPLLPGEGLRDDWPAEEVFRRPFWRHPTSGDQIVKAVRFESAGTDGVSRWAWFIKVHPSAELLRDLRNPTTFGLVTTANPKPPLPGDIPAPNWYPALNLDTGAEILQHPSQGLTLRYHADDNLLYVSDYGKGFAKGLTQ